MRKKTKGNDRIEAAASKLNRAVRLVARAAKEMFRRYQELLEAIGGSSDDDLHRAMKAAAHSFRLHSCDLVSKNRVGIRPFARWCIMRWLKQNCGHSASEIGRLMGVNHGTVLYGLKQCENRIETCKSAAKLWSEFQSKLKRCDTSM